MRPILRSLIPFMPALLSLSAVGCDSQVSPEYNGESLLRISGSVQIVHDRTHGELTPALAFRWNFSEPVSIMDVPVTGSFPSDFQLEVVEPPPAMAFAHPTQTTRGESRVAIGYITAVTSDHPETISADSEVNTTVYACTELREDGFCLQRREENCSTLADRRDCYVEATYCPAATSPAEDCVIEASGDPRLAQGSGVLSYFAGFSQNYQVLYFEHKVSAESVTAAWFGATEDIPAGYGLYAVRKLSDDEVAMNTQCRDREENFERAAELYNRAHGTDYTTVRCPEGGSSLPFCADRFGDIWDADAFAEANQLLEVAWAEHGCALYSWLAYERVENPAEESISVVIDAAPPEVF